MKNCKLLSQLGIAIAVPAVIGAVAVLPVSGVTLRDGKVYFVQPPRLTGIEDKQTKLEFSFRQHLLLPRRSPRGGNSTPLR
ncbi:MAG: hypothetical protein EBE86_001360 [Hormoscilla sp. GUM202]|nr:hypothetical protein [Hormoscilla sp. GUM202]